MSEQQIAALYARLERINQLKRNYVQILLDSVALDPVWSGARLTEAAEMWPELRETCNV
jgi:hypothetical protein